MHVQELSKLAEKDPEFYKYLQEHDRELLEFDPSAVDGDEDEEDEDVDDMDTEKVPILTKQILQKWQKALLEVGLISFFFSSVMQTLFFTKFVFNVMISSNHLDVSSKLT